MPYIENDVLQYFKKEIEEAASEKMDALKKNIEEIKQKQLTAIEEEIRDTIDKATETELLEINTDFSASMNRVKTNSHQTIIKKKHDLMDTILEEVRKKLVQFVKTDQYKKSMEKAVKKINDKFCGDNFFFQIKADDKVLEELIQAKFSKSCTIQKVDTIQIGGFIGVCSAKGILTDQTIDNQLEEAKKKFYERSNLAVKSEVK